MRGGRIVVDVFNSGPGLICVVGRTVSAPSLSGLGPVTLSDSIFGVSSIFFGSF
jgi:hypothetical protein